MIIFADSKDLIFNSRNPNRAPRNGHIFKANGHIFTIRLQEQVFLQVYCPYTVPMYHQKNNFI